MRQVLLRVTVILVCCVEGFAAEKSVVNQAAAAQGSGGQIAGVILDGDRKPVPDARVTLTPVNRAPSPPATPTTVRVVTAANGGFQFKALEAGGFSIVISKPGYVTEQQYFDLRPGENASGVVLRLMKGGVIGGTVRTPSGEPLVGRSVQVLEVSTDNGVPTILALQLARRTDDRGNYRFEGLSSGRYLVRASTTPFGNFVMPGTFKIH